MSLLRQGLGRVLLRPDLSFRQSRTNGVVWPPSGLHHHTMGQLSLMFATDPCPSDQYHSFSTRVVASTEMVSTLSFTRQALLEVVEERPQKRRI